MMNSRELVIVSTAAIFGALASAITFRFLINPRKPSSSSSIDSSSSNGALDNSSKPNPFDPSKRKGYLSWDDYFMATAFLSAKRSKDPNRQVGACLKSINGDPLETKYPYVCHAEVNAILNTNHASAAEQRLYVTMFPCNECAKIIIQSGVSEVIYFVEKRLSNPDTSYIASHRLLSMAGVKVRKHQPQMSQILVKFEAA